MQTMTEKNSEPTMSELANAEIVEGQGGPNEWLMRFDEGDYRFVPRTERNKLIVESDLLSGAEDGVYLGVNREGHSDNAVMFEADLDDETYTIATNGDRITVPARYEEQALRALREGDGEALLDVYEQVRAEQVHEDVVNRFLSRFDTDRLEVTDEGWIVEDTFLVQWNAENYIVDDMTLHIRDGDDTVAVDDSKQARDLSFNLPETVEAETPDGETVTLGQREQEFLATVEVLLNPHMALDDHEQAKTIEDMKEWAEDPIQAAARTARVNSFTDETDGLYHNHSTSKHRIQDLGVTDEVADLLDHRHDGHSALHEMWARRHEFQNRDDIDVFEDAPNDDSDRWRKIENTRKKAPIPNRIQQKIRDTYGSAY